MVKQTIIKELLIVLGVSTKVAFEAKPQDFTDDYSMVVQEIALVPSADKPLPDVRLRHVSLLRSDAIARLLINGSTAFKWKLRCHWPNGSLRSQIADCSISVSPYDVNRAWLCGYIPSKGGFSFQTQNGRNWTRWWRHEWTGYTHVKNGIRLC